MTKDIYSVKDNKSGIFEYFIAENRKAEVIRALRTTVNTEGNKMNLYPEDFDLFVLGKVDIETGIIISGQPEYLLSAYELVDRKPPVSKEEVESISM